jgi:putative copper export protein
MVALPAKRLPLIVLTACVAFAAVFAEGFVLANLGHGHAGEACSVCLQLEAAHNLLEGLGRGGLFVPAFCLVQRASAVKKHRRFPVLPQTLVALKTKNTS